MDHKFLHTDSSKIKSAATEVTAQKTQTPIVAKLTHMKWVQTHIPIITGNLRFYQILSNYRYNQNKA